MQPHQLQYFVAVAETGSFTSGAQRVQVVQSAVSAAVRQLERELGVALFLRSRSTQLTPEGEVLLPRAKEVLASMEGATAAVAATRGQVTGTVKLGMMYRFASFDMASRLASFRRTYPAVVVQANTSTTGSCGHLDALRQGDLDIAIVATVNETVPGMQLTYLDSEPLRFVCPASHPLARSGAVRLEQIADETFIDSPAGWGNRSLVDAAFAKAGLRRTVQMETIDFNLGQSLVREELGVTFVPASGLWTDPGLVALDVEPALIWTARLARPAARPLSAAAAALASELVSPGGSGGTRARRAQSSPRSGPSANSAGGR
ncbi:LysR family transcriptional regulator [Streptomyces iconiensis]|uniref:LysR family transcriptional regulator n=1 Tax=Streptomyces iconiensis TaxID=1384038 RepID=A0ABT7A0Z9_9ACTN|nr:LysR family transcriptional regulator [Streptomyces iconiensis]MDJ1135017.1 LysR family transcriptional regulator [Streptomyces iconiensis]